MVLGRRQPHEDRKDVDPDRIAQALARAVCEGDIVNFRFLFSPFSPARVDSTERFETEKYAYLLPDSELEESPAFREALHEVRKPFVWAHICRELEADRPAQLPWELVLALADNAVRAGKYTSAAQAYELLRIRSKMQEEFFKRAEAAIAEKRVSQAVCGFVIAAGLEYNYAAFPEPLPAVPDFPTRALMLHGEYPQRPEDSLPMQDIETFLRTALAYLLLSAEAAARLEPHPIEVRVDFLRELVHQRDPDWDQFLQKYHEACGLARRIQERIERLSGSGVFAEEIARELAEDPMVLPATLLGRKISNGEWWQYLKELAYLHPAAVLFVSRQVIGEMEILVPRYRFDSPVPGLLGLVPQA